MRGLVAWKEIVAIFQLQFMLQILQELVYCKSRVDELDRHKSSLYLCDGDAAEPLDDPRPLSLREPESR